MQKKLLIFIVVLSLLNCSLLVGCSQSTLVGCSQSTIPNSYLESDYNALVLEGVRYVPLEEDLIDGHDIDHISHSEFLGILESSNIFTLSWRVYRVNCQIPMLHVSNNGGYSDYYVPESEYNECVLYMEQLQWADELQIYYYDVELSLELSKHLLYGVEVPNEKPTREAEVNAIAFYFICQPDSTGSFTRRRGMLWIRAQGDCYYYPNGVSYGPDRGFAPEGEQYDQLTERYKDYQIDPKYWAELNEIAENIKAAKAEKN